MANRLAQENSPYLLQHKDNPVDWYPWGEEALEQAREEDKPIFLSIGYAACHWCHVMEHESFEDPVTAEIMNENFVNIKVDREERPDLDNIYMNAVVALTGHGGWPMSVFLTPEGEPFYGGTYYPPTRRYNMPSFREVLQAIADAWKNDRTRLLDASEQVTSHIKQAGEVPGSQQPLQESTLEQAAFRLVQSYDWKHGGWGQAPKFPQAMAIMFLLRSAARGDKLAKDVAVHVMKAMALGGMYDVVGGGFARYSVDNEWLVPHFEKMLYDNALLARAYLHGFLVTGEEEFRRVCTETLDFMRRELTGEGNRVGFYSSLDADSEGEEGKFYVWTPEQIKDALGNGEDGEFIIAAYDITKSGNFEGNNVLQRAMTYPELSEHFDMPLEEVRLMLDRLHEHLLEARAERTRPATDDKVLTGWNALALIAFAEAARYLEREDYLDIARKNADFLLTELRENDRLLRSWRNGKARHNAYLEDYAGLILGLLSLYQSDPDAYWFRSAVELAEEMLENYRDPSGGFYDTASDQKLLITRPKDVQDNAVPSGNALAAMALLQLNAYTGEGTYRDRAEEMLSSIQTSAARYPTGFGQWLNALDFAINPVFEVAILSPSTADGAETLVQALWSSYRPNVVAAISAYPPPENSPPVLQDRPLRNDAPTAYVCRHFVCMTPVNDPEAMLEQLEGGGLAS